MKKLTSSLLLLTLSACQTPDISLEIKDPISQDGDSTNTIIETTAPDYDIDLSFSIKDAPFEEMIFLEEECYDETYLEEVSTDIVIAEVLEVGDEFTRLHVLDWIKGEPMESSGQISFNNQISTAPEFDEGKTYKIYLEKLGSNYQTTCYMEGVKEVTPYDDL